jgi:hypothetical protein
MTTLFETLGRTFRQREEKKAGDFAALARAVADGKAPKDTEILDQLERFGKSPGDLQSAVELLTARRQAAAALARAKGVPSERASTEAKLREAGAICDTAITSARQKFESAAAPLRVRLTELDAIERAGERARDLLTQTADTAESAAEVADLRARRDELDARRLRASASAHKLAQEQARAREIADQKNMGEYRMVHPQTRADARAKAEGLSEGIAGQEAEAAALAAEVHKIDLRLSEIEAAKLSA